MQISLGATEICALNDVTFDLRQGEVMGILGESGAGKTTLALGILGLLQPGARSVTGTIEFEGKNLLAMSNESVHRLRGGRIAVIYQDTSALNPVLRVGDQIVEVLRAHQAWPKKRYRERALELLEDVELKDSARFYAAYPHQLSGGQRQRVMIAQALACNPTLVIADEPTASLDSVTSAEILELLHRLRGDLRTSFLLISHDLYPLARLADRMMVMYAGRVVEEGAAQDILHHPRHPYSQALLECASSINRAAQDRKRKSSTYFIPGEPPDPTQSRSGCDFEARCLDRFKVCSQRNPSLLRVGESHFVSCFKFGGA